MSDRKREAAVYRDQRFAGDSGAPRTGPSKKDTSRWCKGKVGREHTPEVVPYHASVSGKWTVNQCSTCRKILWRRPTHRVTATLPLTRTRASDGRTGRGVNLT